jgi:PAS domain S-box-containing protein
MTADPAFFLLLSVGLTLLFSWQQGENKRRAIWSMYALLIWTGGYLLGQYPLGLAQTGWWQVVWLVGSWGWLLWGMGVLLWQVVLLAVAPFILAFAFGQAVLLSLGWGLTTAVPLVFLFAQPFPKPTTTTPEPETDTAVPPPNIRERELDKQTVGVNLQAIFDALDEGVVVGDEHGRVRYINQRAADIIGITTTDMPRQFIMDMLAHLPMIVPQSQPEQEETQQPYFEMNGRLIQGHIHLIYEPNSQELQHTIAILHDITNSYQAQRAKTAFLTTISHELRTPLTAIKGYVELLQSEVSGPLSPEQKQFIAVIHRNVVRMVQLINSLIFVSSVRGGGAKPRGSYADLRQLVTQIVREQEPLAARSQQEIIISIDPKVAPIQADSIHISTILQELLNNSIKFNQPGGKIWVTVSHTSEGAEGGDFVLVQVRDEGIGIAPADQLHIFDEFYRVDSGGTEVQGGMGVGLAIVRALVDAYNGRIWLDSHLGAGSTFTLLLPTQQNELQIAPITAVALPTTPN